MIALLTGTVAAAGANWAVIQAGGVGLRVLCTPSTAARLRPGETATVHTSLVVREDSLTLYGFADAAERDCFELAQGASGIGPKTALAVVSVFTPDDFRVAVSSGNIAALTRVPGIGTKGAQRLALELKDKVGVLAGSGGGAAAASGPSSWREQVVAGLEGLGYSTRDAESACDRVAQQASDDPDLGVAELLRAALRTLAK
jgi:Holliday junction DNA helicase RuvA